AEHELVVTVEDHAVVGGFGSAVQEVLGELAGRVLRIGLPDRFIDHGRRGPPLDDGGLTPPKGAARAGRAPAPAGPGPRGRRNRPAKLRGRSGATARKFPQSLRREMATPARPRSTAATPTTTQKTSSSFFAGSGTFIP